MNKIHSDTNVVNFQMNAQRTQRTTLAKHLYSEKCSTQRELVIQLNPLNIGYLIEQTEDAGALIQAEIKLWRHILGPRKVSCFELHHYSHLLQPYQITGLIHRLASEFSLTKPVFRVVFQVNDVEPETLALFKGLSFNHCQFAIEHACADNLNMLKTPIEQARAFRFAKVGVQVLHSEGVENLTRSIKCLTNEFKPDYLFIGCSSYKLRPEDIDITPTLFENDLSCPKVDFLSLGPESQCILNGSQLNKLSDPSRYLKAIECGLIPINDAGTVSQNS